ncbi:MAG: hypothetical protein ABI567_09400 [Gammaproteobacteria bacterium]
MAISEDFERRRLFENALVAELAASGAVATPSTRTMRTTDPLDRDSIAALVKATGSDAVLVTRLVNEQVAVKEKQGREVVEATDTKTGTWFGDPYYNNVSTYDFTVTREPSSLVINHTARVRTDLFDAGEGKLRYRILSTLRIADSGSQEQTTDVAVIDQLAAETTRRLRRDGAVR